MNKQDREFIEQATVAYKNWYNSYNKHSSLTGLYGDINRLLRIIAEQDKEITGLKQQIKALYAIIQPPPLI